MDVAKRIIDLGSYPSTVYFPLIRVWLDGLIPATSAAISTRSANSSSGIPSGILTPSACCSRSRSSTLRRACSVTPGPAAEPGLSWQPGS